ncbi:MAG: hypothetical protein LBC97_02365 [Bifidobacteriaceae bacterium]|nr:hypothetical protein [Bifidobacteriaceae bacterium]
MGSVGAALAQMGGLAENVLAGLSVQAGSPAVTMDFDVLFDPARGRMLREDERFRVAFRIERPRELTIRRALNEGLLESPEAVNWSFSEVTLVEVWEDGGLAAVRAAWDGDWVVEAWGGSVSARLPGNWRSSFFGRIGAAGPKGDLPDGVV